MADSLIDNVACYNHYNTSDILYGAVRAVSGADAGKIRDVVNSAWDAHPASGSLDDYDISAAAPTGLLWLGQFPDLIACPAGFYVYQIRRRVGATPDCGDPIVAGSKGYWNGSAFVKIESENAFKAASTIVIGTVDTAEFNSTTTEFEADDITEATDDHYNGRIVIWTSGALLGQATDITDYTLTGGRGHFTVTAMTEAPANNDTFVIV